MVIICLSLLSCASTSSSWREMQAGKKAFEQGYYKDAFHRLLPLAVNGNPQAQYAVGYMYYYGYGVPEDTESGMFWMNKAAEQHFPPAMTALDLIHQHDIEEKQAQSRMNQRDRRAEIMQSVRIQRPATAPIVVTPRRIKRTAL